MAAPLVTVAVGVVLAAAAASAAPVVMTGSAVSVAPVAPVAPVGTLRASAGSPPGGTGVWIGARGSPAGDWQLPVEGPLTVLRGFDPPEQRWQAGHRGVDLLGRAGAVVRSAGAGRVSFAGAVGGVGSVAVTHPDGTRTTYQPLVPGVPKGAAVGAGSPLGRLAVAGGHCLPATCLHWGRLRGQVYLDPLLLVRRGPPRLLPVWSSP